MTANKKPLPDRIFADADGQWWIGGSVMHLPEYIRIDASPATFAALPVVQAMVAAAVEDIFGWLHVCDTEAHLISMRISGQRGKPCRHPDGVQVLEDAEAIFRVAMNYAHPDAAAALSRMLAEARNAGREEAAAFVEAHGFVSRGNVSPLSQKSDPPLTREAADAVAAENDRLRKAAGAIDSRGRALTPTPHPKPAGTGAK